MINSQSKNEFNQNSYTNSNLQPDENNVIEIVNTYDKPVCYQNEIDEPKAKPKISQATQSIINEKKSKENLSVLLKFVFLFAAAAVIQTAIPLPIFSEIFSPSPPATVTPAPPTPTGPTATTTPEYLFDSVTANHYLIYFSVTINNVDDFLTENYYLLVVKAENDDQTFINSLPAALVETKKVKITTKTTASNIGDYISPTGFNPLNPGSNYSLLLLKDGVIIKKQAISTTNYTYITGLTIDPIIYDSAGNRYCHIHDITVNTTFTNYTALYVVLINQDTGAMVSQELARPLIEAGTGAQPSVSSTTPVANYELRIYAIGDDITEYLSRESIQNQYDPTKTYYLVYTHSPLIVI